MSKTSRQKARLAGGPDQAKTVSDAEEKRAVPMGAERDDAKSAERNGLQEPRHLSQNDVQNVLPHPDPDDPVSP
jgi:hypothetical protein